MRGEVKGTRRVCVTGAKRREPAEERGQKAARPLRSSRARSYQRWWRIHRLVWWGAGPRVAPTPQRCFFGFLR